MITVALGHFASDFAALGPSMLYPILAVRLDMSYGMIGLAALAWAITTSVIQPLFGYIGDRMGRRWLASVSPAWIAVWVAVAASAPSYPLLVVYLVVAAVGVAAFHPQGAAIANEAQGRNTGTNVALFFLGGHAAFAVAPLVLGGVLEVGGTDWMPVVLAPVLLVSLFMAWSLRNFPVPPRPSVTENAGRRIFAGVSAALVGLLLVAVVRGWAYAALATFIPVFVSPDRPDPIRAGIVLSGYLIGHAVGAFAGGVSTDRFGVRRILGFSSLVMIPAMLGFGLFPFGPWHIPLGAVMGAALGAGFTPTVVMVQRLLPGRMGAASGVVLGLSFGAGAVGNYVTGIIGDAAGLNVAFGGMALAQLVVLAVLPWMPRRGQVVPSPASA
ncbi:MAG: MFS transporter [Chloroflexota bacterium]|nr:MFS transporter [Chloroflexota bacterium]